MEKKLKDPCKKCCVDIICKEICPNRISYSLFINKTEKFCERTNLGLAWVWLFIVGVRWATNIMTNSIEQNILPILFGLNFIIYGWVGLYLKIKVSNKNYNRFNLSYYDIQEMDKKFNEENLRNTERR
jgi:uncharacterized membrane protein (DUF485 family)